MFLADDKEALDEPTSTTMLDLVMARQLGIIRRYAVAAGVAADAECYAHFGCHTQDLSRRAAAAFIEHLSRLPESRRQKVM